MRGMVSTNTWLKNGGHKKKKFAEEVAGACISAVVGRPAEAAGAPTETTSTQPDEEFTEKTGQAERERGLREG